ncbi:SGNH/GDSL hydrolase family protein [Streptomyces buecherae]|uniref:SGNH/GDSL hydrolase family protein n=1 Tax=Streptomyces buecherae TaxID=2763006 RepID=UPI003790129B
MTSGRSPHLVALGDSMALGRNDPEPRGGWRGWAPRLALNLGISRDAVVNTAAEGAVVADVVKHQIPGLTGTRPEVVAFSCGMNDVMGGTAPQEVARDLDALLSWAAGTGAVVVTTALLPCWDRLPLSRVRRSRLREVVARFNQDLAATALRYDAQCLDPAGLPATADPAMWSRDGIHLSPSGHQVIAEEFTRLVRKRLPLEASTRLSLGLGLGD